MQLKSILQILLLSAAWGVSFLMMRIAVVDYPPLWISMLRCALGAFLMWLVLLLGRHRLPPRRLFHWLLMVALLNNAVPFSLFAWGERWVPSNTASVLNATVPIWTLLLSMWQVNISASPPMAASPSLWADSSCSTCPSGGWLDPWGRGVAGGICPSEAASMLRRLQLLHIVQEGGHVACPNGRIRIAQRLVSIAVERRQVHEPNGRL